MFITELSIRRPVVSWVMSLILIVFGLFVFWKLPVRELPSGIQPPVVQVQVNYNSAAAIRTFSGLPVAEKVLIPESSKSLEGVAESLKLTYILVTLPSN